MKVYRTSSKDGIQTFTSEERLEYLKNLSLEIRKDVLKRPEGLIKEESEILLDLLKIEFKYFFNNQ